MSTVLVFVVIPAAVLLVVGAMARTGSDRARPTRRYRPGRPYDFAPIWFLSAPEQVSAARADSAHASSGAQGQLSGGAAAVEPRAGALALEDPAGQRRLPGPVGGASDRW